MIGNSAKILPLTCGFRPYHWGKLGSSSKAASLGIAGGHISPSQVVESERYAEIWMASHPRCPSRITSDGKLLSTWLQENGCESGQLSFLFKVLSIGKPLEVQIHPNKSMAEKLHKARPDLYPDSNHKPEMIVALTPLEAMAYFRPAKRVADFCRSYAPLGNLVGDEAIIQLEQSSNPGEALRYAFSCVLKASEDSIKCALQEMVAKLTNGDQKLTELEELFLRLKKEFPDDCGCFSPFFINYFTMQPGEVLFIEANMPHAFVSGDCMECMACSDNVILSCLAPPDTLFIGNINVDAFLEQANFDLQIDGGELCQPIPVSEGVVEFVPPLPDFKIVRFDADETLKNVSIGPFKSHAVFIVMEGSANVADSDVYVKEGSTCFIPAGSRVTFQVCGDAHFFGFAATSNDN